MKRLTRLQIEVLERFFARQKGFFLTGGAALAGFHLGHRETHDLDLFTTGEMLDEGERSLEDIAKEMDVQVEPLQRAPAFRRFLLSSRETSEALVVDLVKDESPQLAEKLIMDGVVVDSAEEILANKLCALLSRVEVRDLVDVRALAVRGIDPVAAVGAAARKDAGVTASQLAWVVSSFPIPGTAAPPGDVSIEELRQFRDDLARRLAEAAFPG